MKKELLTLCVALVALGGCQQSDGLDDSMELAGTDAFSSHELALFGEKGGMPWGDAASTTWKSSTPAAEQQFGKVLAVADMTGTGKLDVITAQGAFLAHGKVLVRSPGNDEVLAVDFIENDESSEDSFGMALAAGDLCPELGAQVVIASAPSYNGYQGGFGLIYKKDKKYQTQVRLSQPALKDSYAFAGTRMTVGDVDGDGKNDLVFQSTPLDLNYNYLVPTVSVVLDVCSLKSGDYTVAASVNGSSENFAFGSELHIVDLDGKGQKEIVILDNLYREPENIQAPNGAIFFYRWESGKLVESRKPIIGEHTRSYGAAIQSVAFSDLDNDGDLDLIVGEPMVQVSGKREGRVRTYTNNGSSNAFDRSDVRWSAVGGRSHARFGSKVIVADVNNDGVNDLLVSAPGLRQKGSSMERAQAMVYVYMGTKDGSIFSKEPFWTYLSNVSTNINDDFGRSLAVANLDDKGWADLIVAAPLASSSTSSFDEGRVDIFMQSKGHCYTASGCFVQEDGKCYMASGVSDNNKCLVCDPSQNNFGLVELVCKDVAGECRESTTCHPDKGCQANNKPNGTACGETACTSGNYYSHFACKNGECLEDMTYCGHYSCDISSNGCLTSCNDNSDCATGNKCVSNQCVEDKNLPPSVIMPEKYTVIQGESITLSASAKDPDGDKLTYQWDADKAFLDNFSFIGNRGVYVAAGTPAETYYRVTVTVTDEAGNSASASTTVYVTSAKIEIVAPEEGSVTTNTSVTISGFTNTSGSIAVRHADSKLDVCKASISKAGWECQATFSPGDYAIVAFQTKDESIISEIRHFTIASAEEPNQAPIVVLNAKELNITTGGEGIIDASASHDPDGDELTYSWKCSGSLTIQEDAQPGVALVKVNDAAIGSSEVCSVTITDSKKATTTANITINITAPDYHVTIVSPENGDTFKSNEEIYFKVKTDYPDAMISILHAEDNRAFCRGMSTHEGDLECYETFKPGDYKIYAALEPWENWIQSEAVIFTVIEASYDDYFITLTSPKLGDIVQNPVTFEGAVSESIGPENGIVVVYDVEMDKEICRTAAQGKGAWNCVVTDLPSAQYNVEARLYSTSDLLLGVSKNVNFALIEAVSVPVITSPKSGDTVSLRPTVSGQLDGSIDGKVHVWYTQEGEKDTLLCTADIKADKTWACTAGYDLEPGTTYSFQAMTENSNGKFSQMSQAVVVTTQAKEVSDIVILSPTEGAKVPNSYAVIIMGSASVGSKVDVYVKQNDGEDDLLCSAVTTAEGRWACEDLKLSVGTYTIYADDASQTGIVASNSVNFTIIKGNPTVDLDYNNARGGSCSMTTTHASNFGWLMMLAGFAGFGLIRRRRVC